jgi:hypothetical protein
MTNSLIEIRLGDQHVDQTLIQGIALVYDPKAMIVDT